MAETFPLAEVERNGGLLRRAARTTLPASVAATKLLAVEAETAVEIEAAAATGAEVESVAATVIVNVTGTGTEVQMCLL